MYHCMNILLPSLLIQLNIAVLWSINQQYGCIESTHLQEKQFVFDLKKQQQPTNESTKIYPDW